MSGPLENPSPEALAAVAHLARSENRLRVLAALADGAATRRELEEETGIARATVGRALAGFEERGWVVETAGREYETTPSGARLAGQFAPFLEAVAAIDRLGDRVAWLPTDDVPIDLRHFSDATVRRPEPADPLAPAMALTDRLRGAGEFHCLVGVAPPLGFEQAMRDGVVAGELVTRHVITAEELAYLRKDLERLARWREYVDAGGNLYCYDGDVPCNLLVFDETVVIGGQPVEQGPAGLVESEDDTVRSWAHGVISVYQRESERLGADSLQG